MAGRVAIVGAGYSAVGRDTGFGYKDLAVQSALAAMGDCGIRPGDIDGLSLRAFGQPEPWGEPAESALNDRMLAHMLGHHAAELVFGRAIDLRRSLHGGDRGSASGFCHTAWSFIPAAPTRGGTAHAQSASDLGVVGDHQFAAPFGAPGPGMVAGITMQRHMAVYGTTEEQFGMQQVAQRSHARLNERALLREPLSLDGYLEFPVGEQASTAARLRLPVRRQRCRHRDDRESARGLEKEPGVRRSSGSGRHRHDLMGVPGQHSRGCAGPVCRGLWSRTDLSRLTSTARNSYDGFSVFTFAGWRPWASACPVRPDHSLPMDTPHWADRSHEYRWWSLQHRAAPWIEPLHRGGASAPG